MTPYVPDSDQDGKAACHIVVDTMHYCPYAARNPPVTNPYRDTGGLRDSYALYTGGVTMMKGGEDANMILDRS